jgi:hypothetical protein
MAEAILRSYFGQLPPRLAPRSQLFVEFCDRAAVTPDATRYCANEAVLARQTVRLKPRFCADRRVDRPRCDIPPRLLAKSVDGHTEPYLLACGITKVLLAGLLRDGLATWSNARAGIERPIDIVRVKITDAGRRALTLRRIRARRPTA